MELVDAGIPKFACSAQDCVAAVDACIAAYGRLDILVNNAAIQHYRADITEVCD